MKRIKVALVGVGNCASALVQGRYYYQSSEPDIRGLMRVDIGGYSVGDIDFVAAFDVDNRKVGKDLSEAIFSDPNCTTKFSDVPYMDVIVLKGPVLDGVADHMRSSFMVDDSQIEVDVAQELKKSRADLLICYLPVGSAKAARFYAQAAIDAGVGFINAIPEFICSDDEWIKKFEEAHLPCAGDDVKSQVGATIIHRVLARLIGDRGHTIDDMYQLNIGGNTDFLNMTDERRLVSKRKSKTQAVMSAIDSSPSVRIGPSYFVPHLKDRKICYINIRGRQFGDVPFDIDLKLSVEDSPNSAGVMMDVIRTMKIALDRGISGNLDALSAYCFKSPHIQMREEDARRGLDEFINSERL